MQGLPSCFITLSTRIKQSDRTVAGSGFYCIFNICCMSILCNIATTVGPLIFTSGDISVIIVNYIY